MNKTLSITLAMRVEFYDVDSYKIVWHGNYPKYFEVARCKLLELIGFTYKDMELSGFFFPIIDINIKYVKPLVFGQSFSITATLKEWRNKLTIDYRICDSQTNEVLTKGYTSQIAVSMPDQTTQFIAPQILIEKVNEAIESQ